MTYIIGEIGQNHNGSVDLAKLIIDFVSQPVHEDRFDLDLRPMDAVKMTKRDLDQELTDSAMARPYENPNSFGKTYGEHREKLELSDEEHYEVYKYAKEYGMDFVETLCAPGCLSILKLFRPDYLKVASRDLTNIPLLEALAETRIPMILSTGMVGKKELDEALEVIAKKHSEISILHCVSQYPTEPQNVNLRSIDFLQEAYGDRYRIGYSDHTIGIAIPTAAVARGAEIIEKHITLDRRMKGTDQASSLGPDGIYRMVRDIRLLEKSLGEKELFIEPSAQAARTKLERSLASNKDLEPGHRITEEDLKMLSPGDGYRWTEKEQVVGRVVKDLIPRNEIIYEKLLKAEE